jgi:hypothetical protein
VKALELRRGERLRGASGSPTVSSILTRETRVPVYNLEVETVHVFSVHQLGILVHNSEDKLRHVEIPKQLGVSNISWFEMPANGAIPALQNLPTNGGIVYFVYDGTTGELLKVGSLHAMEGKNGTTMNRYRPGHSTVKEAWAPKENAAWAEGEPNWVARKNIVIGYETFQDAEAARAMEREYQGKLDGKKEWSNRQKFGDIPRHWEWDNHRTPNGLSKPDAFNNSSRINAEMALKALKERGPPRQLRMGGIDVEVEPGKPVGSSGELKLSCP